MLVRVALPLADRRSRCSRWGPSRRSWQGPLVSQPRLRQSLPQRPVGRQVHCPAWPGVNSGDVPAQTATTSTIMANVEIISKIFDKCISVSGRTHAWSGLSRSTSRQRKSLQGFVTQFLSPGQLPFPRRALVHLSPSPGEGQSREAARDQQRWPAARPAARPLHNGEVCTTYPLSIGQRQDWFSR